MFFTLYLDPLAVVVPHPKIAQIVSYMSFQKRKKIVAAREMEALQVAANFD